MSCTSYSGAVCREAPFASPKPMRHNSVRLPNRKSNESMVEVERSNKCSDRRELSEHVDHECKPVSFQTVSLQRPLVSQQNAKKIRFFRQQTHELQEDEAHKEEEWNQLASTSGSPAAQYSQSQSAPQMYDSNARRPPNRQNVESLVRLFKSRLALYNEMLVNLELLYMEYVDGDDVEGAREVAGFIEAVKGRQEILGTRLLETDTTLGQMAGEKQTSHGLWKSFNILHGGTAPTTTSSPKLEPSHNEKPVQRLKEIPKNESPRRLSSDGDLTHRCIPPLRWRSMFSLKSKSPNRRLLDDEWSHVAGRQIS